MRLELPRSSEFGGGVWYSTHASTWYPAHYHEELELKLVLSGETSYRVGAERVTLGAGSLLWLWPGQEHAVLDASKDLAMWVASFRVQTIRAAEVAARERSGWQLCALTLAEARDLSVAYAAMASEVPDVVNARAIQLLARARSLSGSSTREQRAEEEFGERAAGDSWHPAVVRARTVLRECGGEVSIADVARQCGTEPARLSRLFRKQMGLAPVQFRNHARVQQFIARFGRTDDRNMLQVALDCGFGSYPQFHRAFHQVTGYAPSEHLRRVRAGLVFPVSQSASAQSATEKERRSAQEHPGSV